MILIGEFIVPIKELYLNLKIEEIDEDYILNLKNEKKNLSNKDRKYLSDKFLENRYDCPEKILSAIIIYSFWEPDEAVQIARKKGVFRYGVYGGRKNIAHHFLVELIKMSTMLDFNVDSIQYLQTKESCSWLFDYYKKYERKIIAKIIEHNHARLRFKKGPFLFESSLFKELLAYLDLIFHHNIVEEVDFDKEKLRSYSKEEIGEAISYIVYLFDNTIGIKEDAKYVVNNNYVLGDEIESLLLMACKLNELQEWEVCIDYFDYGITIKGREWIFHDQQSEFEKSIRLGYVRTDLQQAAFLLDWEESDISGKVVSIETIANTIIEKLIHIILEEVENGDFTRYRFVLPEILVNIFEKDGSFDGKWFEEEYKIIQYFARELSMNTDEILNKQITDNCKLSDVILFQRFFILMDKIIEHVLHQNTKSRYIKKVVNSLIPVMSKQECIIILDKFTHDNNKSNELLDLFTYRKGAMLDLQYTPIISAGNKLFISNTIIAKSNLLRNVIASSYQLKNQKVNQDQGLEPLTRTCENIFNKSNGHYQTFSNRRFRYNKQNGEIDLIVISDTDIILIECKAPLLPVNNFELRSSWDHINKANKQLNLSKKAFSDKEFRNNYLKGLQGVSIKERSIRTCIIMGNRLFTGYDKAEHPIRYIYELDMILNSGVIRSSMGSWRIWADEEYSHNELIKFLSEDSFVQWNHQAMVPVEKVMRCDGKLVKFLSYSFNVNQWFEILETSENPRLFMD